MCRLKTRVDLQKLYNKINKVTRKNFEFVEYWKGNSIRILSNTTNDVGIFKNIVDYVYIKSIFCDNLKSRYVFVNVWLYWAYKNKTDNGLPLLFGRWDCEKNKWVKWTISD